MHLPKLLSANILLSFALEALTQKIFPLKYLPPVTENQYTYLMDRIPAFHQSYFSRMKGTYTSISKYNSQGA